MRWTKRGVWLPHRQRKLSPTAVGGVPNTDRTGMIERRDALAVGRDRQGRHPVGVAVQQGNGLTAGRVPKVDGGRVAARIVPARGGKPATVRVVSDAVDIALRRQHARIATASPHPSGGPCRRNSRSIWSGRRGCTPPCGCCRCGRGTRPRPCRTRHSRCAGRRPRRPVAIDLPSGLYAIANSLSPAPPASSSGRRGGGPVGTSVGTSHWVQLSSEPVDRMCRPSGLKPKYHSPQLLAGHAARGRRWGTSHSSRLAPKVPASRNLPSGLKARPRIRPGCWGGSGLSTAPVVRL